MSPVRIAAAVTLATLVGLTTAIARTAPDDSPAPAPAPAGDERRAPAPPAPPAPAIKTVTGGGGVGFNGPNRKMQMEVLQIMLKLDDEAWKLVSPKLEKVLAAKNNLNTGAGMNWTTSSERKPEFKPSATKPDTAPGRALQSVRDGVADETVPDEELAKRMTAVRETRKQARAEYDAAQAELTAVITPRQQALLMTLGVLD